jgi:hypothetical protein
MTSIKFKTLFTISILFGAVVFSNSAFAEWSIDLSRRTQQMRKQDLNRSPAAVKRYDGEGAQEIKVEGVPVGDESEPERSFVDRIFDPGEPTQDIVILNTERGFVPNTIRIRKDGRYMVHVVNVNEKEKNVSFILDGFSEHHATFFGKVKTFKLEPRKEGVYSFMSPETAVEGRFIVFTSGPQAPGVRLPATAALTRPVTRQVVSPQNAEGE